MSHSASIPTLCGCSCGSCGSMRGGTGGCSSRLAVNVLRRILQRVLQPRAVTQSHLPLGLGSAASVSTGPQS